ncbi:hypothetical protein OSCT_1778 [Oscillochloris trichoides DG-6]|uniref:NACHT domain-containing protein n=1 Tax=Oscillochloris trichoides DG-6 TaxID=765420 RepID=E1IEM7_9CHLR|nr:SUMF1/EgtB/PvdO family nonheme iron enzyme [Oscillochloris trichoides]EFO80361.1 hypothetical protein OSCT_1778 [Oscillochloris trichoides DG-6]
MTAEDAPAARIAALRAEIAEVEEELAATDRPRTRAHLEDVLAHLRAELANMEAGVAPEMEGIHIDQSGHSGGNTAGAANTYGDHAQIGDDVHGPKVAGGLHPLRDAFVATEQTIQYFFGAQPPADAAALLREYLERFATECDSLRLQRITGQRQTVREQPAVPELRLQAVYTSLTTDGPPRVRLRTRATVARVRRFLERLEQAERSPDAVSPERVITVTLTDGQSGDPGRADARMLRSVLSHMGLDQLTDTTEIGLQLERPELAIEAIAHHRRLVLLGEPGSGKSTVLRYLGHILAQRAGGAAIPLKGWPAEETPLPILIPLAQVAEQLTKTPDPDQALWQTIGSILDGPQGLSRGLRDSLHEALRRGGVILLCDGLDELSAEGDAHSPRTRVSEALQRLIHQTRARVVVTSRVLPYQSAASWHLPATEGWHVRTLTALAFGQVRTFVQSWFHALTFLDTDVTPTVAQERAEALLTQIADHPALEPLVRSPLLLTMLTLLHDNDRVPENEVMLYEQCVLLLLERWEPVRQPGMKRPGLIERLGNPPGLTLARLRDPLHQLAYEAHRDARGDEGRGVISDDLIRGRLTKFFERLGIADQVRAYKTFQQVLAEDAGLLVARGDEAFAFPHLSFQEYLAACYLAGQPNMRDLAYSAWQGADRERWRKVLVLLAGRLAEQDKAKDQGLLWLKRLWAAARGATAKPAAQRNQDVRLAALTYQSMGGRAAFAASDELDLDMEVEQPLRGAVAQLLNTPDAAIPANDRLIAGTILADLDDPRFPVTHDEWQASLAQRGDTFTPTGEHYWRYLPAGRYRIGGKVDHDIAAFWVARLPITVAQFARFVAEGYREDRHWTENGLKWRGDRTSPYQWNDPQYSGSNQPVVLTWYEATAFCDWLTRQLKLPSGYALRLPTEAECEVAAAYDGSARPRTYPWGEEPPTPERAVYKDWKLDAPAPVGLCPAGMAACGAMDLAGNVWEWCSSHFEQYPEAAYTVQKDFTSGEWVVPLRGGAYYMGSTNVRCGARDGYHPDIWNYYFGFRVVVSPPLAHTS